ncbi:hypothetical protein VQ045_17670 [Aurantimonas sp. E1-2-R+4]|uniref:type VI toxin-antitoxin system SocB family DNA replication inhibitor toxin n=1 Tax=Aurantimonas sp. E1-2-R+4 TaxID=3113714 RepID=UPI002F927A98
MTTRPLPDIDLARIAPQPYDMKRKSLEQMRGGRPPFSYKPVRSCFDDIFNIQPDLDFGSAEATPWSLVEEELTKRCRSEIELIHNKRVARGLHDFATSGRVMGRKHDFFPLAMGVGRKVTFWLPMVLAIDDQPHAIFVEPRRSRGLTAEGRRFAFSMMHERIRAADEDFADVCLAIVRFADPDGDRRDAQLFTEEGVDLYSLDELELMVASTYDMWSEVLEERDAETRRRGTGTGSLI